MVAVGKEVGGQMVLAMLTAGAANPEQHGNCIALLLLFQCTKRPRHAACESQESVQPCTVTFSFGLQQM